MKTGRFFEVNISQDGRHILATDSSIRSYDEGQIISLVKLLKEKFPPEEKYNISVTVWSCGTDRLSDELKELL